MSLTGYSALGGLIAFIAGLLYLTSALLAAAPAYARGQMMMLDGATVAVGVALLVGGVAVVTLSGVAGMVREVAA